MTKVKPESLAKVLSETLNDYAKQVEKTYGECGEKVASDAVKKLKMVAFGRYDKGKYSKSWAYKQERGFMGTPRFVIYNKKHYRLTHLLEYGHVVKNGTKRVVGQAGAIPHIKPIEEWVQTQLPKDITQKLGG